MKIVTNKIQRCIRCNLIATLAAFITAKEFVDFGTMYLILNIRHNELFLNYIKQ